MPQPETGGVQNKREYSRVEAQVPLEIRVVRPEEGKDLQSRVDVKVMPAIALPGDVEDPQLAEWLKFINVKLDTLLSCLNRGEDATGNMILTAVKIGGGGFSFTAAQPYDPADTLEVKMLLPSPTPTLLYLYCEVVQSEARNGGYFTALRFILLDDAVRDKILRFVFEKEREMLRAKRRD
jgi:hypothetical protein